MSLGKHIKNQRTRAGLSQEIVSKLVGGSHQSVTKWESGQSAPSTENLFRLAEIFGTTVDMLLDIPDEKNAQSTDQAQIKELTSQIQYLYRIESAQKSEAERVRLENEKRIEEIQNKSNKVWLVQILFGSLCVTSAIPLTIAVFSDMNPTVISVCAGIIGNWACRQYDWILIRYYLSKSI
ncbi:MAG: helix-turn-helix domain-containing protein [Oscillospiraceae bacterium]|nr:helix-turn-helix domain-containing protein [Oscillospiraceae bacterium]